MSATYTRATWPALLRAVEPSVSSAFPKIVANEKRQIGLPLSR
jgi:hypothetical protein